MADSQDTLNPSTDNAGKGAAGRRGPTTLSFVKLRDAKKHLYPVDWWAARSTGDYSRDREVGEWMAIEMLDYMLSNSPPGYDGNDLGMIACAMVEAAGGVEARGLILGFMEVFGSMALAHARNNGTDVLRMRIARREELFRLWEAAEAKQRSERARHAANARWGKAKLAARRKPMAPPSNVIRLQPRA